MESSEKQQFRVRFGELEVEASGSEAFVTEMRAYADQLLSVVLPQPQIVEEPQMDTPTAPEESPQPPQPQPSVQPPPQPPQPQPHDHQDGKEESLVEFLGRVPNSAHLDKILAFGFFLEHRRSMAGFGIKEINDCYDEIREAKGNTAQCLLQLMKSGLLMKAKDQGAGGVTKCVLTRMGVNKIRSALGRPG
jgi:hypothetical protein